MMKLGTLLLTVCLAGFVSSATFARAGSCTSCTAGVETSVSAGTASDARGSQAPATAASTDSRWIVCLSDGTHLRGPARETASGFDVKTGESWRAIARDDIASARRESDVLAERRERLGSTPPAHLGSRVEDCRWMIGQGLDAEAVVELDRIVRLVPDERHVLLLLASTPPRIDLDVKPGADGSLSAALMREGARTCNIGASPVRRELVVQALARAAASETTAHPSLSARAADAGMASSSSTSAGATAPANADAARSATSTATEPSPTPARTTAAARAAVIPPPEALRAQLVDELGSSVIARRTFACIALRRLYPDTTIGPLAVHAVLDPSVDVRDEAILGLREAHDPQACGAVVRALANPSALVRNNAIEAIGRIGYPEGVEPLMKLMLAANAAAATAGGAGGPVRANLYVGLQTAYVQDYNVQIAQGASIADPIIGVLQSGLVFDVGVGGVSSMSVPISTEIWSAASSLVRLTGARIGADPPAWERWWNANRERYVPGAKRDTGTRDD